MEQSSKKMRIANISIHCFKSFAIRLFHSRLVNQDVEAHSIFFKDSRANNHTPVTDKELRLLCKTLEKAKADLFGISIYAPYVTIAKEIVKEIRKVSNSPIVIGGVYSTITPDKALDIGDYACKGEGEVVVDTIVDRLKKGQNLKNIPGLWYKDEHGKVVDTGLTTMFADLNEMPYQAIGQPNMYFIENSCMLDKDPELIDEAVWIMAGRGCMYQCSFCVNAVYIPMNKGRGKFLRQRTPENVVCEIEERVRNHITPVERVFFADELFGIYGKWIEEFCEKYKKRVNIPFYMELHPNLIKEDNIRMLAEAGLMSLDFGIQSGSDRIRNGVMNRPGTNKGILESAHLLKKYNVSPVYDLILENPFETDDDLIGALKLIMGLPKPLNFNAFKMQYFPNYPYTAAALKAGYVTEDDLTEDKVSINCLTSWTFVPAVLSKRRKDHLQSCIYLVIWNIRIGDFIARKVLQSKSLFWGNMANLIARITYQWLFRTPVWAHRCVKAAKILLSGDLKKFMERVKIQLQRKYGKLQVQSLQEEK